MTPGSGVVPIYGAEGGRLNLFLLVLLEGSHESHLVLVGLEAAVTELAAGVDELEIDLLQGSLLGVNKQRLPTI
jgi:hypothetical protein